MLSHQTRFLWTIVLSLFYVTSLSAETRQAKFKSDVTAVTAVAKQAFDLDLRTLLSDQGNGNLVWSAGTDKPAWIVIDSANSRMTGTPAVSDVSEKSFRLAVSDGDAGAITRIDMKVITVPEWASTNIDLGNAKEDSAWQFDLKSKVTDPAGQPLTFSVDPAGKPLPAWIKLDPGGVLSGTPRRADVGAFSGIVFIATTQSGGKSSATASGSVLKTIHPPKWKANPFTLTNAQEDFPYSVDVSGTNYIDNFEGATLSFTLTQGTASNWLQLTSSGSFFGTPKAGDVGPVSVKVTLSATIDGQTFTDQTLFNFNVLHTNHPPRWTQDPLVLGNATTKVPYFQDLSTFVVDPDGDKLTFRIVSGPSWLSITPAGVVSGTPDKPQVGVNEWTVEVSDGEFAPQALLRITVVKKPPFWLAKPTVLPKAKEDFAYSQSLASYVKDPDGDPLTFTLVSGPAWATVSADGTVTGTPKASDVGPNKFQIKISDGVGGEDQAEVQIQVDHTNHAPKWNPNPIALPDAKERSAYTAKLSDFASDPDTGDTLTFSKLTGPAWATIAADGTFSGTPARSDVGANVFTARVTDQGGLSADVTININVIKVPVPPSWTQNPIPLTDGLEDSPYSFSVAPFVSNPDGSPLTYKIVSGPAWLTIGADGTLSGTPAKADVGPIALVIEVSDGTNAAQVNATGKVNAKPLPPTINADGLNFIVKERQTFTVGLNDPKYVQDPKGLPLTFTLVDSAPWVSLAADGTLTLTPAFKDIGQHAFKFHVANPKLGTDGVINVKVVRDPRPPVWTQNPINFAAQARVPFTGTVADKAKDLDGLPITFSKKSGPAWLTVDAQGNLSGTPQDSDVGDNTFVLTVQNDALGADATVVVSVKFNNHPPVVHQAAIEFTVKERQNFAVSLNQPKYVEDQDGDKLTFTLLDTAAWVTLSATGDLALNPAFKDIGDHTFKFNVSDGALTTPGTITVHVVRDPRPPVWTQNPINFTAQARVPFTASVADKAKDLDGFPITFSKTSGPAWLTVDSKGNLSGTPADADVGSETFVITVKNDVLGADANVIIDVKFNNHPPVVHSDAIVFNVKERQVFNVSLNQPQYVQDPDTSDTLTFTLVDNAPWVSLTAAGDLTLKPGFKEIGDHTFNFKVSDGTATVPGTMTVHVVRDPRPPVWSSDPIKMTAKARVAFSGTLADKAKDLDGLPITFSLVSGPSWLKMDAAGNLSGTPQDSDVGDNTFSVSVKNDVLAATATLIITVGKNNHPPAWTQDPILLPYALSGSLYSISVAQYATDPDNDTLTFSKVSGPDWITITANGTVTGTPATTNIGNNSVKIQVSDPSGASATATATVMVIVPPRWLHDPVNLTDATEGQPYSFDLSTQAVDDQGLPLTFKKISGPAWLSVGTDGKISGTPAHGDVGSFTAVLEVSNGKAAAQAGAVGKVLPKINPPVIHQDQLNFTVKERQTFTVSLNQAQYVENPDGGTLTFTLLDTDTWVALTGDGNLTLTPQFKQIGDHAYKFRVSNGKSSADGIINVKVIRDPRAPQWLQNPIQMQATSKKPFTGTLADKAKDLDGLPLTFTKKSGPAWLTVAADGTLSGTPADTDIGDNTFVVTVSNDALGADATLVIKVISGDKPPFWVQDPITLPNGKVATTYAQSLASYAKDPAGGTLTFQKLSGPDWAFITTAGLVIGTPAKADTGLNTFKVRVTNPKQLSADVTVLITVDGILNHPPQWTQDPIQLGTASVGIAFQFNLAPYATDPDGDVLKFKKVSGPAWLLVSDSGQITGTPAKGDVGNFTAVFEVTDGIAAVQAGGVGKVVEGDKPPVFVANALTFTVKERDTLNVNINQPQYVSDPAGSALTFELVTGEPWVTLSTTGGLSLKPQHSNLGDHTFSVRATNAKGLSAEAPLLVKVVPNTQGPIWLENPIRFEAKVNQPFSATLAGKAKDPNNLPLTFSKTSGPDWLTVAADGTLSGTPLKANVGDNTFTVTVRNDTTGADATVIITVKDSEPTVDTTIVDTAVPGATAENLWVIDNSWPWVGHNEQIKSLKNNIHYYFEALDAAQVHHTGIFLSSDVARYQGLPIPNDDPSPLLLWNDNSVVNKFQTDIEASYSKKCSTSPLWSMFRFYQQAPSLSFYHNGYFAAGDPMDVLIVTKHTDAYKKYAKKTPQAEWGPDDYTDNYVKFHNQEKMPYRISAISAMCEHILDPEEGTARSEEGSVEQTAANNPYRTLVQRTKGQYFNYDCHFNMQKTLKEYSDQVIFRAYVSAKRRIPLSKKPTDPASIQVFLAGKPLASDKWSYDDAKNEIVMNWNLIDLSSLKPGDKLEIKYQGIAGQKTLSWNR